MADPSCPTGVPTPPAGPITIIVSDDQDAVPLDASRWAELARAVLADEGCTGELTLTFVDRDEIAGLNREHMGVDGPTDVLSFPLDAADDEPMPGIPVLLGDIVVCPEIAAANFATHAGTLDDELALLVVHGVLHVLGHDHAQPEETIRMRAAELAHLKRSHWRGDAPAAFRQEQEGGH